MSATRQPWPHLSPILPKWAAVGFCARCARRAERLFKRYFDLPSEDIPRPEGLQTCISGLSEAISIAELGAVSGHFPKGDAETARRNAMAANYLAYNWFQTFDNYDHDGALRTVGVDYAKAACLAAELAGISIDVASETSLCERTLDVLKSMVELFSLTTEEKRCFRDIPAEYKDVATAARQGRWTDDTPFPLSFFALRSRFDIDANLGGHSILEIGSNIQMRALELLGDPQQVFRLTPREFEEVIAEILDRFGFSVELTARTRDGGRDIIAVSHRIVSQKYLVECKRYALDKPVGIGVVQRLHGVTRQERATKGIVVTSSRFTYPAKTFMERERWLLEGRDMDGLREWLEDYQKALMLAL